jgi:hypothetical protein
VAQGSLHSLTWLLDDVQFVGEITVDLFQRDRMLRHGVGRVLGHEVELAVWIKDTSAPCC